MPQIAHPQTWAEFITACGYWAGNDIVELPENAVWDMTETPQNGYVDIYPPEIRGNGTTIKNLHGVFYLMFGTNSRRPVVSGLRFENFETRTTGRGSSFLETRGAGAEFYDCKFSGVTGYYSISTFIRGANNIQPADYLYFNRCSFNFESTNKTMSPILNSRMKECVVVVSCPNAIKAHYDTASTNIGEYLMSYFEHCELVVNLPRITKLKLYAKRCTLRGDLTGVTELNVYGMSNADSSQFMRHDMICVYDSSSAPNAVLTISSTDPEIIPNFVPATTIQLMNAEYLESIGFPIGGV